MQGLSYDYQGLADSINELDTSTFPSSSQRAAIFALLDFKDEHILAWLTLLRSLQEGYKHLSSSQALSGQHIGALSLLKDSPDVLVREWLRASRYADIEKSDTLPVSYHNDLFDASRNGPSTLTLSGHCSSNSIPESSGSSLGPLTHYSRSTSGDTATTSISQSDLSSYFGRQPAKSTVASPSSTPTNGIHTHWCMICENPKALNTCDGWKRHMKEHEVTYRCLPQGPVQASDLSLNCSLCGAPDPDQAHLDAHLVQQCIAKPRTYTRKANLVKHLELHGIQDGYVLADAWRIAYKKRYYSCGFCIALFNNINDQLNHVDMEHFRRFEDICNMDMTKVIRGLLLQPGVDTAWRNVAVNFTDSAFSWDGSMTRNLQHRLELAEETPETLATAAFNESKYDWSRHCFDEPDLTMSFPTLPMNSAPVESSTAAFLDPNAINSYQPIGNPQS